MENRDPDLKNLEAKEAEDNKQEETLEGSEAIKEKMPVDRRRMRRREKFVIGLLTLLCAAIVAITIMSVNLYVGLKQNVENIKYTQQTQYKDHVETRQFLLSTIDWKTRRQKVILFMRDQIVDTWKKNEERKNNLNLQEAYEIAEANMLESERYPHVDPLFHLALQWQESRFNKNAISEAGAIGLNQIMPATGRLLAGFFNMEYNDRLLKDIKISTKFSAKYAEVLYAQYGNFEQVLAGYNGGPYQAYYYLNDKDKLVEETRNYVKVVIDKWSEYKNAYKTFRVDSSLINKG